MTKPFIATVELGGPFKILARQLWIKADDREQLVTGGEIKPKAVQASSTDEGTDVANLSDYAGLSNRDADELEEHGVDPAQMWRSAKGDGNRWIEFDLDQARSIGTICLWNYNDSWFTDRGVSKADISVWTQESGWKKIQDDLAIGQAEGSEDYDEPTVVQLDGIKAQKVRLDDLASLGDPDYVGLSKVQFFELPGPKAIRPKPHDGSADVGIYRATLKWKPGLKAARHRVYVGAMPTDLKLLGTLEETVVHLSTLAWDTSYYWRIDEVQDDATVAQGEVWSFTTGRDVTGPMDVVVGVPNEGVTTDMSAIGWPGDEPPGCAIDDEVTSKYLHLAGEVLATGFGTTPRAGSSVVTGLTFTTANDYEERDPVSWELYGSNESIGGPYQLIARGEIADFNQPTPWPRRTKNVTPIAFENDTAYKHYQILFPAIRDPRRAVCMQIAEVELLAARSPQGKPSMDGIELEQGMTRDAHALAAWWKLDEMGGDTVADSSGNGIVGTFVGKPQWAEGIKGGALQFDGASAVDFGNPEKMMNTGPLTIACWIKPSGTLGGTEDQTFLARDNAYIFKVGGPGLRFTTVGVQDHDTPKTTLDVEKWQHVAVTFRPETAGGCVFYINAVECGRTDASIIHLGTGPVSLARDQWPAQYFKGSIDDVCVFSYALDAVEVKALYDGKEPTEIAARSAASVQKLLQATVGETAEPAVVSAGAAADPNAHAQPSAETASRGAKNGIAVVIIIGIVVVIAGMSFFTKRKDT